MTESLPIWLPILACFCSAILAIPVLANAKLRPFGSILALGPLIGLLVLISAAPKVLSGEVLTWSIAWAPALDLSLDFRLNAWALVMGMVVTGVGAPLLAYAVSYGADDPRAGRMTAMLAAFAAAMLGLVFSDHLLMIYVCWEITSVLSFLLVGHKHEYADARYAARRALVITVGGGLALLAGLLLLAGAADTWSLTEAIAGGNLAEHPWYVGMVCCFFLAAATKSAQFPFHVWLPGAMAAPTPVSCYLHAATMVKAGVYLLAVLTPLLGGTDLWLYLIGGTGTFTAAYAGIRCSGQTDAKGLVAWSTVSALGMMMMLVGLATPLAATALICLVLAHALYKATLFMVVGCIDHGTHTRDLDRLGGLGKAMPRTAAAAGLAAISFMGLPPAMGFVAKEYFLKAGLYDGNWWGLVGGIIAAVTGAGAAVVLAFITFWRGKCDDDIHPHESPWGMTLPPLILATTGFLLGPAMIWLGKTLVQSSATVVAGAEAPYAKAWPGTDLVLLLSLVLAATGAGVAFGYAKWRQYWKKLGWPGGGKLADRAIDSILTVSKWHTQIVVHGNLRWYLALLFIMATVAIIAGLLVNEVTWSVPPMASHPLDPAAMLLISLGLLGTMFMKNRLAAITALGALGAGVAIMFIGRGAADLALTQLLVEALTVLLFVLAFRRLPDLKIGHSDVSKWTTGLIAVGFSIAVAAAILAVPHQAGIGADFHELSWVKAYGRNVVNVILVDFRAFDTMGEIAVLGLAALGVLALVKQGQPPKATTKPDSQQPEGEA
jgi:multicomponent Na+:H+ antiporter subunit A